MNTSGRLSAHLETVLDRLRDGGLPYNLAREFGVSVEAINYHRRRAGIPPPQRSRLSEAAVAEAIARIDAGESVDIVAKSLHTTRNTLYRRHRTNGGERTFDGRWMAKAVIPTDPGLLGYIAGIIDGEGSIIRRKDGYWVVKVGMTDDHVVPWLATIGGTTISVQRQLGKGTKDMLVWTLARRTDVVALLRSILPYLKLKQERAARALAELDPA